MTFSKKPTKNQADSIVRIKKNAVAGKMFRTTIDIEAADYKRFKALAAEQECTVADKVRAYIKDCLQ